MLDGLGHLGDVSAPIRMIMATLSPLDQDQFWKKLAEAAAQFTDADGALRLPNAYLVAVGQRCVRHEEVRNVCSPPHAS